MPNKSAIFLLQAMENPNTSRHVPNKKVDSLIKFSLMVTSTNTIHIFLFMRVAEATFNSSRLRQQPQTLQSILVKIFKESKHK